MPHSREDFDGAGGVTAAALDTYAAGHQGNNDAADDFRYSSCLNGLKSFYATVIDALLLLLGQHIHQKAYHVCS